MWPRVETTPPVTPAQLLAEDKTELSRPTCEEDMLCAVDGSEIKQQAVSCQQSCVHGIACRRVCTLCDVGISESV